MLILWKCSSEKLLQSISDRICEKKPFRIATVNLEYVLEAKKNIRFSEALDAADARVCDGAGLQVFRLFRCERIDRIPGADFVEDVLQLAWEKNWRVFLAVRRGGLSSFEEVRSAISKKFPMLNIRGFDVDAREEKSWRDILENIERERSSIVLCNFGIPEQEYFLRELQKENLPIVSMGVGGAFDFITGKQNRAPRWMRSMGLEWLYRFARDPRRIVRFFSRAF